MSMLTMESHGSKRTALTEVARKEAVALSLAANPNANENEIAARGNALALWFEISSDTAAHEANMTQARDALLWLGDAITNSNDIVADAVRALLAVRAFSANSEFYGVFDPLRAAMEKHLSDLVWALEDAHDELGDDLTLAVMACDSTENGEVCQLGSGIFQAGVFDSEDPIIDEEISLHVLMLIARGIDAQFHDAITGIAEENRGRSLEFPVTPFDLARSQMTRSSGNGFRCKDNPRSVYHTDLCKHVIVASSPADLQQLAQAVSEEFGAVKVVDEFALTAEERAERYHLLSLRLIIPFMPLCDASYTFADLCASGSAADEMQDYMASPSDQVPEERWAAQTQRAYDYIHSDALSQKSVSLLCTVEFILENHAKVRDATELPLMVVQAKNGLQLWETFAPYRHGLEDLVGCSADTFCQACLLGQVNEAKHLLDVSVMDIDSQLATSNMPVLHWACTNGLIEIVEWLVDLGASIELDVGGLTPLMKAVQYGNLGIVRILLEKKAQVDLSNGTTPLILAAQAGVDDIVCLLLRHRANQHQMDASGATPLASAARNGCLKVVQVLLEQSKRETIVSADDIHLESQHDCSLHVASAAGHLDIVKLLLRHGFSGRDNNGLTPLHAAARSGHLAVANFLLHAGANANEQDIDGSTALHMAAENGMTGVIMMLIDVWHCPVDQRDSDNVTPLFLCALNGHVDAGEVLLGRGADCTIADITGATCLHCAAEKGHVEMVSLLLHFESGRSLTNVSDSDGATPLFLAAKYGHEGTVKALLDYSDHTHVASDGWTAHVVASNNGHQDVAEMLEMWDHRCSAFELEFGT